MRDSRHLKPVVFGPRCRWDGGPRRASSLEYIVIHDAESPSDAAQGVANYGARTPTKVSWHVVVDDNILICQLPDLVTSWTAPPLNQNGLHIELCGRAAYSRLEWYRHQGTLKRAAWQVAKWCKVHKIPPTWLSDAQLDEGEERGIVTHAQVSRVFKMSTHSDPGPNFPMSYFMLLVRRRLGWLG